MKFEGYAGLVFLLAEGVGKLMIELYRNRFPNTLVIVSI